MVTLQRDQLLLVRATERRQDEIEVVSPAHAEQTETRRSRRNQFAKRLARLRIFAHIPESVDNPLARIARRLVVHTLAIHQRTKRRQIARPQSRIAEERAAVLRILLACGNNQQLSRPIAQEWGILPRDRGKNRGKVAQAPYAATPARQGMEDKRIPGFAVVDLQRQHTVEPPVHFVRIDRSHDLHHGIGRLRHLGMQRIRLRQQIRSLAEMLVEALPPLFRHRTCIAAATPFPRCRALRLCLGHKPEPRIEFLRAAGVADEIVDDAQVLRTLLKSLQHVLFRIPAANTAHALRVKPP